MPLPATKDANVGCVAVVFLNIAWPVPSARKLCFISQPSDADTLDVIPEPFSILRMRLTVPDTLSIGVPLAAPNVVIVPVTPNPETKSAYDIF